MDADGEMLSRDHADVDSLLDDALDKLRAGDPTDAFDALDLFWARLAMHVRAEHLHLFPVALKICEMETSSDFAAIPETIERLRDDHNFFMHELAEAIRSMRSVTTENEDVVRRDARRRLESVRDRLVEHNVVEEEHVYPLRKFLSPSADEELLSSLARELDNLPPRFRKADA